MIYRYRYYFSYLFAQFYKIFFIRHKNVQVGSVSGRILN